MSSDKLPVFATVLLCLFGLTYFWLYQYKRYKSDKALRSFRDLRFETAMRTSELVLEMSNEYSQRTKNKKKVFYINPRHSRRMPFTIHWIKSTGRKAITVHYSDIKPYMTILHSLDKTVQYIHHERVFHADKSFLKTNYNSYWYANQQLNQIPADIEVKDVRTAKLINKFSSNILELISASPLIYFSTAARVMRDVFKAINFLFRSNVTPVDVIDNTQQIKENNKAYLSRYPYD